MYLTDIQDSLSNGHVMEDKSLVSDTNTMWSHVEDINTNMTNTVSTVLYLGLASTYIMNTGDGQTKWQVLPW